MQINSNNIAEEIKSRCNIVDVIGQVVTLKKAGNSYKGLCPFHNEKTPSFIVSESKQIYKCFGCGAGGDVITFVQNHYNLEFREAIEMLAKQYGIELPEYGGDNVNRKELFEINRQAARFFYRELRKPGCPGYEYMRKRGLSDETLRTFGIGFADDNWTSLTDHLTSMGFDKDKLYKLGLVSRSEKGRYYDKFRNRVIFPIINTKGDIIGFGGRIIGEGEPKYLNSQETPIFLKKNNLYGLNLAKDYIGKSNNIILVEGYMDVIALYQAGIRNVSASLGTALTSEQAGLISRYTKNVILSYDADSAGQNAAERGMRILYDNKLNSRVLKVSDGKDPDEFISKNGRMAFLKLIDEALSYGDFMIKRITDKYDLADDHQRAECAKEAVSFFATLQAVDADIYVGKLAKVTGISEMALRRQMSGLSGIQNKPVKAEENSDDKGSHEISIAEKNLLRLATINSKYADYTGDRINEVFTSKKAREIIRRICDMDINDYPIGRSKLRASIEAELLPDLDEIFDIAVSPDKEEQMYLDCLEFIRKARIEGQIKDISDQMEMGEGIISDDEMRSLMSKLMELQKQIKG